MPEEIEPEEMLEKLCWADLVLIVMGEKDKEDVRFCEGVSCNYCRRFGPGPVAESPLTEKRTDKK
jgi:hypothetical protein